MTEAGVRPPRARAAVLLYEPQDPVNVGSVVRVCRNCGMKDLRVFRPRTWEPDRIQISAPRSIPWIEENLYLAPSWEHAVSGLNVLVAVTGKSRSERNRRGSLPDVLQHVFANPSASVGFVFGREDHGIPNDIVDRCDWLVTLESDPEYPSFNLAQAALLVCHAIYSMQPIMGSVELPPFPPAPHQDMERFMERAEAALDGIGFFRGSQRENVLRTLRRVVRNAEVDTQELATLWGIFAQVDRLAQGRLRTLPTPTSSDGAKT